jgi:ParB family chromosome partitioning protein
MRAIEVPLEDLQENPYNPRSSFDEDEIADLGERIESFGLVQRLTVRKNGDGYEVVAGERRLKAMQKVGYDEPVPCDEHDLTDEEAREYCLVENLDREDLTSVEEAWGYAENIIVDYADEEQTYAEYIKDALARDASIAAPSRRNSQVKQLAQKVSPSEGTIKDRLFLLSLPENVLEMIESKRLPLEPARVISDIRVIDSADKRQKEMNRLANKYAKPNPDISRLRNEVQRVVESYEQAKEEREEALKNSKERLERREEELMERFNEAASWFNNHTGDNDPLDLSDTNLDDAEEIATTAGTVEDRLNDRYQELRDHWNNDLLAKQSEVNARRDWLQDSIAHFDEHDLECCPTCEDESVDVQTMQAILDGYDDRYDEIGDEIENTNELRDEAKENVQQLQQAVDNYRTAQRELEEVQERIESAP